MSDVIEKTLTEHRIKPEWHQRAKSIAHRILVIPWNSPEDQRSTLVVDIACEIRDQVELEISRLKSELEKACEALKMYAAPESYHAIAFMFDRPCGSFEEDFSSDHGHEDYDRPMPGKLAREALKTVKEKDDG